MSKQFQIDDLRRKISSIENGVSLDERGGIEKPSLYEASEMKSPCEQDAFKKIVALVNVSDRSERTIRERLEKAQYCELDIDESVERAKRCGIIDDMRFADVLIRSRLNQGKGCMGIERELREQGIRADEVPGWPYEFGIDDESERKRALSLLEAHPTRSKNKREGAYRKLVAKGYSSQVASDVARTWSEMI